MNHLDKLDFLLTSLYSDRHGQFQSKEEIHEKVKDNLTFGEVSLYLNRFSSKGYLMTDLRDMGESCISIDVYKISFRGVLFFESSPFIWKNRPNKWKSITGIINNSWTIAKTIMAASSTLAIIYIGYLQWRSMDKVDINYIQHEQDIKVLYDAFVNVQMDRDSLEKRILKLESE